MEFALGNILPDHFYFCSTRCISSRPRSKIVFPYLQYVKGIANHATNTTRNCSGQKFHVKWSIRTRTQIISHGSVGCLKNCNTHQTPRKNESDNQPHNFTKEFSKPPSNRPRTIDSFSPYWLLQRHSPGFLSCSKLPILLYHSLTRFQISTDTRQRFD